MPNVKKIATPLKVNEKATLSHETASLKDIRGAAAFTSKPSLPSPFILWCDSLAPKEALIALFGGNTNDEDSAESPYSLEGCNIDELLDNTTKAIFHFTDLMNKDGGNIFSEFIQPLHVMYQILNTIKGGITEKLIRRASLIQEPNLS